MTRRNDYTRITLTGLNLERHINTLRDNNIDLYGIKREQYNKLSFYVEDRAIDIIKQDCKGLDIQLTEHYGIKHTFKYIISRIGLVIGVILSTIMLIVANMFTIHINIVGLESIDRSVVIKALNDYGIYRGKINNYTTEELNQYLISVIDGVSLVSSAKIGTSLVINIKEKSAIIQDNATNYVAPYNMVINDFDVYAGISNISIGSIVKQGDVLIYTSEYIDKDGVLHLIAPSAKLNVTLWHTATEVVMKEETIYTRTGNSVTNYSYSLANNEILSHIEDNQFEYFEVVEKEQLISNTILPIRYKSTTYFETTPEIRKIEFEKVKEKIIANLQTIVYNKRNEEQKVVDEKVDIIELNDRYIINIYLQCTTTLYIGDNTHDN